MGDLDLHVTSSFEPEQWDSLVSDLDGGFFHSSAWVHCRCEDGGSAPHYLTWHDSVTQAARAAAVGFRRPRPERLVGRVMSRLHFNTSPAARDSLSLLPSLNAWVMATPGVIGATLGALDGRAGWSPSAVPHAIHSVEFVVRPTGSPAVEGMREMARRSVRRALRLGVEVVQANAAEQVMAFAELARSLHEHLRRHKGGGIAAVDTALAARAWSRLIAAGSGRLYLGLLDGVPVTGCLFGHFNGRAYYLQNGAVAQARSSGATYLVLSRALDDFCEQQYREINLGPIAAEASATEHVDHGLYEFKAGLGATIEARVGGRLVTAPLRSTALDLGRRAWRR